MECRDERLALRLLQSLSLCEILGIDTLAEGGYSTRGVSVGIQIGGFLRHLMHIYIIKIT